MAVVCPACAHIHFETNRSSVPGHCAGCGHDLSAPAVPPAPPTNPGPPAVGPDRSPLLAGVAVLCAAGWLLLTGVAERGKYVPVTATMTVGYLEWAPAKGGGARFRDTAAGEGGNAYYVVDGQKYRTTVDRRWRLGEEFQVWYSPDAPEEATEVRPYGRLIAAVFLMAVGLILVGRGCGLFGAAVPPPVESLTVPIPTDADVEAVPPPLR